MHRKFLWFIAIISFAVFAASAQNGAGYPNAKKVDQVDDYHGVKVSDPYRWMEDTKSADTQTWIEQQNKITDAYLGSITERDHLRKRFTEVWNYER